VFRLPLLPQTHNVPFVLIATVYPLPTRNLFPSISTGKCGDWSTTSSIPLNPFQVAPLHYTTPSPKTTIGFDCCMYAFHPVSTKKLLPSISSGKCGDWSNLFCVLKFQVAPRHYYPKPKDPSVLIAAV
jgi:hypothetical protein